MTRKVVYGVYAEGPLRGFNKHDTRAGSCGRVIENVHVRAGYMLGILVVLFILLSLFLFGLISFFFILFCFILHLIKSYFILLFYFVDFIVFDLTLIYFSLFYFILYHPLVVILF